MSISYLASEALSGFKRARISTLTAITSLAIAVLLLGLLIRMGYNAYYMAQKLREMIVVEVFLKDGSTDKINQFKKELSKKTDIKTITYISKEKAADRFLEAFGSEGTALANLNFLPASFQLNFKENVGTKQIKSLITDLESKELVDEIRFDEAILKILESRIKTFGLVGAGISLIIMFMAMLLVYNTIRLTIFSKQLKIRAMKLVGATKGFIRRPFLVEGLIQGILGSGLAFAGVIGLFDYIIPKYIEQLGVLAWPFGKWYYLAGIMIGFGALLGLLGSLWATGKFIKAVRVSN